MHTTCPVKDQSMSSRFSLTVNDDLAQHCTQDSLLQRYGRIRVVPQCLYIFPQRHELGLLLIVERGRSFSQSHHARLDFSDLLQRMIPSRLQFASDQAILGFDGIELPACPV